MNFERRNLADLRPAVYNPRKKLAPDDPEYVQIRNSLSEFGYADPIVINADGTIIKGHQRCNVMMDLGYTEAEVIVLDIPDKAKEKALNVALNKITGRWDDALLKDLLAGLDLEGYDFTVTGFGRDDLDELIRELDIPPEAVEDGFDVEAAEAEVESPKTRPGDLWQLGRHRLLCGDAADPKDVERLLAGKQLELVITDPPYNVDFGSKNEYLNRFDGGGRDTVGIARDHMDADAFAGFLRACFQNINAAMRPGAAIYVFHADVNGLLFRRAYTDAGLKLAQVLIWEKQHFVLGRQDYQWRHEPILYGWKEGAAHYFIDDHTQDTVLPEEETDLQSMKKQELLALLDRFLRQYKDLTSVQYEARPARSKLHPTMKPVPLVGRLMNNSSKPGWLVGDFFAGSGTTLIAAEQLGRTAYLMELSPRNVDVIVKRWEDYTGEKAVRLPGAPDRRDLT